MINEDLKHKLDGFIRKYYTSKLLRGSMYSIGLGLIYFLLISFSEYYGHFSGNTRLGLLILLIIGLVFILSKYILSPLMGLVRLGKHLSYEEAGRLIGKHFPDIDDKIVNTLELGKISWQENALIQASIDQRTKSLNPIPFSKAVNLRDNLRYWPILIIPILVFAVIGLSGNLKAITEGSKRIVAFDQEFLPEAPFSFVILNDNLKAEEGQSFTVKMMFEGDLIPESAEFETQDKLGRFIHKQDGSFEYTLENLASSLKFRVNANGFYSKEYEIEVVPVPRISSFILEVTPPSYTGIKPFISSKSIVDVPEGSQIVWDINTQSTLRASLETKDSTYNFNKENDGRYSLELPVSESLSYNIRTENKNLSKNNSSNNQIDVIKDAYPEIEATIVTDSITPNVLYFDGIIVDDYGFSKLLLLGEMDGKSVIKRIVNISRSLENQSFSGLLDLDSLAQSSKTIKLSFTVWDNDAVNGTKSSRSASYEFNLLSKKEREEQISEQYESYFSNKDEQSKNSEEILKEMERLRSKLLNQKKASWKDKEQVRQLLQKQKGALEKQKELNRQRDELEKKDKEPKNKSEDLKKKEDLIDELKKDPKQEELEKLMEEINKLMEKLNPEELKKKLDQMQSLSEQNQRREERLDKLLKDLKFQKDVLKQSEKLDELAKKMEDLASEENEKGDEQDRQDEAQKEFDDIKKEIDKLEKENQGFKENNEEKNLDKTEEEIDQEMNNSQEQMQNQEQQKANENQQKSSEKMQEMSQQMMQSLMQMQSGQRQEDMKTLRQILENLEILSFDVEDLSRLSRKTGKSDPIYRKLLKDQKVLMDGATIIEDSLIALGERVPEIQEIVYDELEAIKENLEASVEALEEQRGPTSASKQQFVMTAANNLALLLDDALRNMQQQMANMMQGNQSCQKPGSGKPSPSNMQKMQNELGEKMSQMMKGQKKGQGKPQKGEGRDGKEMVEMLSKQEQIRRQLEEYMEEKGSDGSKGNMADAIEEMKKIEEDLLKGEISLESLNRIKEIETRLLEFEKAELEQKQDEKRESKSAEELDQLYKEEREKYLKEKEQERENINYAPLNLKNYYKRQTNKYLKEL